MFGCHGTGVQGPRSLRRGDLLVELSALLGETEGLRAMLEIEEFMFNK
jgi:hypothetical protein